MQYHKWHKVMVINVVVGSCNDSGGIDNDGVVVGSFHNWCLLFVVVDLLVEQKINCVWLLYNLTVVLVTKDSWNLLTKTIE